MSDLKEEIQAAQRTWLDGGPPLPLIRLLVQANRDTEAGAIARLVLTDANCPDRDEIETVVEALGRPPQGWAEAVSRFAQSPTVEAWEELMRFTPSDVLYHRKRNALRVLRRMGVDPNVLFHCATHMGITPEAIELAEDGLVSPETILARSAEFTGSKAFFLSLAAEATFLRGDILGTIRLIREAFNHANEWCSPEFSILFIRGRASDDVNAMLDRAGIPRL